MPQCSWHDGIAARGAQEGAWHPFAPTTVSNEDVRPARAALTHSHATDPSCSSEDLTSASSRVRGHRHVYAARSVGYREADEPHSQHCGADASRLFALTPPEDWRERARGERFRSRTDRDLQATRTGMLVRRVFSETRHLDAFSALAIEGLTFELLAAAFRDAPVPSPRPRRWHRFDGMRTRGSHLRSTTSIAVGAFGLAAASLIVTPVAANAQPAPITAGAPPRTERFDLERHLFPSPEAEIDVDARFVTERPLAHR